MIVPMKKAFIIVQEKDAPDSLAALRKLGLLHIEHQQPPQGKEVSGLQEELAILAQAVSILSERELLKEQARKERPLLELSEGKFIARHIIDLHKRLEQLEEFARTLMARISQWQAWGDFQPQAIAELAKENIYVRLYQIPLKEIKHLPKEVFVEKLQVIKGIVNCAVLSFGKAEIPYKEIALPKISLNKMRLRLTEDKQAIATIKAELGKLVDLREKFLGLKKSLAQELEFQQALKGMAQAGTLAYLSGYLPFDALEPLVKTAKKEKWGLTITEPSPQDQIPTLIRNPAWVSLVSPLFKILEIVPGYAELDISLWFLIFFSIFFGILIGDAGYGAIYLLLTFFAQRKFAKKLKNNSLFLLFYLLSSCAVIWGVLSGTFFGQEWLPASFKPLIPALRSSRNTQAFCFFLGALHLSIAHLWRAILKAPSLAALADIGWMTILWGAFFLAQTLVLGEDFPAFGKWFFIIGPTLVVFFAHPKKNILKGIGSGLGALALNFVNTFTDVVSYIRLFAVGLASVAVADAFNKMALGIGFGNFLAGLLTSLILILGHLLNIVLGPLAVLVHGVRLNVLEFCSHVNIKWSGFSYKPLEEFRA